MDSKKVQLTIDGKKKLEERLKELKKRLKDIAKRMQEARELGDLSENSSWDQVQDEYANTKLEISEIEEKLKNATIISKTSNDKVSLGNSVIVKYENGSTKTMQIVPPDEADPAQSKISAESPIGKALLGKKLNNTVNYTLPSGDIRKLSILNIE